jgi:hypothetical protein
MQCTSTRQFERQEPGSPKTSEASGVCKLLVRTERRSSSALNAAHDDKQSISLYLYLWLFTELYASYVFKQSISPNKDA